eukprot:TRINITY_DN13599_c0_g1_i1.p1 TRINITY_DN13599_c0_g1~~TRINITY_DN13599_c0_g1_i1.p1  ORF type:complete len:625 (+),score=257.57 TRINITY_DN13599_c0_g1_i1:78-1952(+)
MLRQVSEAARRAAPRRALAARQRRGNMEELFDTWRQRRVSEELQAKEGTGPRETWLSGVLGHQDAAGRGVAPRKWRKATSAGRLPKVDYLAKMEEAYGPKESWHRADEAFMRRMMPVLCRKVDDLRERVLDVHRHHREFKLAAQKELKKIPLYKREAWMSPDLTRSMLVDDLKSKGYLDGEGRLLDVQAMLAEHRTQLLAELKAQGQLKDASKAPPSAALPDSALAAPAPEEAAPPAAGAPPATTAPPPPTPPAAAFSADAPLIIDPLLNDVHAPQYAPPPEDIPELRPTEAFAKVPSARAMQSAMAEHGMPTDVDKLWVQYPNTTVQADVDSATRRVTKVAPVAGAQHFDDPAPRVYDVHGGELSKRRAAEAAQRRGHPAPAGEAAGQAAPEEAEEEAAEGEPTSSGDAVMDRLKVEKKRRKKHKSKVWSKLADPEVKPGNAVHDAVMVASGALDAAGVPLDEKLAVMERVGTAVEAEMDLTADYPAYPERGPDAVDPYVAGTQEMDRQALKQFATERDQLRHTLRPRRIDGAQFVPAMPKHDDALNYQHQTTTDEGVWYKMSGTPGEPGEPVGRSPRKWPKEAVLVPWDVHEDAERGHGYKAIKAQQELVRLTAPAPDEGEV